MATPEEEFILPDVAEVRRRIEDTASFDTKMMLKATYLFAARISEVVANASPADKTKGRGPKGTDANLGIFKLGPLEEPAALFSLRTAKRKGWPRVAALPLNYEPWAQELFDYFQRRGENRVFPFTRQLAGRKVREMMVFTGLEYSVLKYVKGSKRKGNQIPIPNHNRSFNLHALRHLRASELISFYGFTPTELSTYGGWTLKTAGFASVLQRYLALDWQSYFPKLLKRRSD